MSAWKLYSFFANCVGCVSHAVCDMMICCLCEFEITFVLEFGFGATRVCTFTFNEIKINREFKHFLQRIMLHGITVKQVNHVMQANQLTGANSVRTYFVVVGD